MRRLPLLAALATAFSAGILSAHWLPTASAQSEVPLMPMVVHLPQLSDDDVGPARPGQDTRARTYVSRAGVTVGVQTGNTTKHFHANSDEIQYIVAGSGTMWLGDKLVPIGPGDLVIVPRGVTHAGATATTGRFKAIAIKTPPQAADDTHPVP
ncbi:MAG: cupin domain-containing protein [Pseudomonadota bacterium]